MGAAASSKTNPSDCVQSRTKPQFEQAIRGRDFWECNIKRNGPYDSNLSLISLKIGISPITDDVGKLKSRANVYVIRRLEALKK